MEKKFSKKLIKIITTFLVLLTALLLVSCEDDAILEPQSSDDCQGSYCNLSLNKKHDFVFSNFNNPEIY